MKFNFKILIIVMQLLFFNLLLAQNWILQVNTRDGTSATYNIQDIKKITFGEPSGIQNPDLKNGPLKSFKLFQNYPNPFNPTTKIKFEIPQSGQVQIRIFNSIGQLVKELTKTVENAGIQSITWDGKNQENQILASGLYICQVKFEESILVTKMIMIK